MIRKIINYIFLSLFFFIVLFFTILSTLGVETDRFNKLITNKIANSKDIELKLKILNFKLDLREFSLFVETQNPKITYISQTIPAKKIKVYIDFISLLKTDLKIKKINISSDELNYIQLNELSKFIKPSNFKNFINNKIKKLKLTSEIELFIGENDRIKNYIIKGRITDLRADLFKDVILSNTNLNFFADKEDILIKNIFGKIDDTEINNGDIKLNLENGIKLNSNFITNINLDSEKIKKLNEVLERFNLGGNFKELAGNFSNNISVNLDKTYKVKNYNYSVSGELKKSKIELFQTIKNNFNIEIKEISLLDAQVDLDLSKKNFKLGVNGKYSLDNLDFLQLDLESIFKSDILEIYANFDYKDSFDFDLINYKKPKDEIAKVSLEFEKNKNISHIKNLNFKEKNNLINIRNLKFKDNNFESLKTVDISTKNNNFSIQWDKKIMIRGSSFDATNLPKFLNQKGKSNNFKKINTDIEIDFINIKAPLSEKLKNFRLIGEIKKGKFIKISSKGDFGGNNFLDISLKKDNNSEKKFLEIYSDITRPLLTEYSFFKGLSGGKLLFTSLIDGPKSNSKL